MIWVFGPHICDVEASDRLQAGSLRSLDQVKKPFHRLLLKLVHPDCRLSERRFDFHSMRVSGEKTALVQIVTSAP
jgi:hypothetical protein